MAEMTTSAFPLRFKDPETKRMLRLVSDQLGVPMNELAEDAIRHELVILGAQVERQLSDIVTALQSYDPQTDLAAYLDAFASGEGQDDPVQAGQRVESKLAQARAAFKQ
jgi:phosphoribosylamine-glycine ligase